MHPIRNIEIRNEYLFHALAKPWKKSIEEVRRRRYGSTHKATVGETQIPAIYLTHKENPQGIAPLSPSA